MISETPGRLKKGLDNDHDLDLDQDHEELELEGGDLGHVPGRTLDPIFYSAAAWEEFFGGEVPFEDDLFTEGTEGTEGPLDEELLQEALDTRELVLDV